MPKNKKAGNLLNTEHRQKNVKVIISVMQPYVNEEIAHVILPKKRYIEWLINELQILGIIETAPCGEGESN